MIYSQFLKFVSYLIKNYQVFGPQEIGGQIFIKKVTNAKKVVLDQRLPFYSFKKFFLPKKEILFEYQGENLWNGIRQGVKRKGVKKYALLGVNILDLKAVLLYNSVFENDPYYQARRQNILIIGHSFAPEPDDNIFEEKYEADILEHLGFDIFLATNSKQLTANSRFQVFTGSQEGQEVLEKFGYKNYQHIQFSGPISEEGPEKRMEILRSKLKNHHNPQIWQELGKICIECGKCSIVCPTCFCFRVDDCPYLEKGTGERQRSWDSCFYQEFSEVAGGAKFLKNTAERIHFWYYHKFARIPDEYNFMGCVGCRRCAKVCPVGIDIAKVLKQIEGS